MSGEEAAASLFGSEDSGSDLFAMLGADTTSPSLSQGNLFPNETSAHGPHTYNLLSDMQDSREYATEFPSYPPETQAHVEYDATNFVPHYSTKNNQWVEYEKDNAASAYTMIKIIARVLNAQANDPQAISVASPNSVPSAHSAESSSHLAYGGSATDGSKSAVPVSTAPPGTPLTVNKNTVSSEPPPSTAAIQRQEHPLDLDNSVSTTSRRNLKQRWNSYVEILRIIKRQSKKIAVFRCSACPTTCNALEAKTVEGLHGVFPPLVSGHVFQFHDTIILSSHPPVISQIQGPRLYRELLRWLSHGQKPQVTLQYQLNLCGRSSCVATEPPAASTDPECAPAHAVEAIVVDGTFRERGEPDDVPVFQPSAFRDGPGSRASHPGSQAVDGPAAAPRVHLGGEGRGIKAQYAFSDAPSRRVATFPLKTLTRSGRACDVATIKVVMCRVAGAHRLFAGRAL
ncbi:hypothetical protein HYPSUDRAFT_58614 [Hypholoma sublateritium FD-334 SS-4]|uniref:Uncharacterized protein n=1 Tax=Hypholoma sublateritium (strain FD-334 SS-4) TaxID=945553 RepID=A0A0D2NGM9_HYPSF|nr:hypothetical protein HYPSUDRAFT_58614 [Hypholoma sublateritium FD-334 SS-4]